MGVSVAKSANSVSVFIRNLPILGKLKTYIKSRMLHGLTGYSTGYGSYRADGYWSGYGSLSRGGLSIGIGTGGLGNSGFGGYRGFGF